MSQGLPVLEIPLAGDESDAEILRIFFRALVEHWGRRP